MKDNKHELTIIKKVVEGILRRPSIHTYMTTAPEDIAEYQITSKQALRILGAMIPHETIYVIADSMRFASDFGLVMQRRVCYVHEEHVLQGLENFSVVILHTGTRTQKQQEIYNRIRTFIDSRRGVDIWHVGEWRF